MELSIYDNVSEHIKENQVIEIKRNGIGCTTNFTHSTSTIKLGESLYNERISVFKNLCNKNFVYKIGFSESSLYSEIHILKNFKKDKVVKGIPEIKSSGVFYINNIKFRYLQIPFYKHNLTKEIFRKNPIKIIVNLLNILKTIHEKKYVHFDIKPKNIMIDDNNEIFLIDYDLTRKFDPKPDEKKKYIGTKKYISRDACSGIVSYKADLESLFYTILYLHNYKFSFLEDSVINHKNFDYIEKLKISFFKIKNNFKHNYVKKLFNYISEMSSMQKIDYEMIKNFFV